MSELLLDEHGEDDGVGVGERPVEKTLKMKQFSSKYPTSREKKLQALCTVH